MKVIKCCEECYRDNDFLLEKGDVLIIVDIANCEVE